MTTQEFKAWFDGFTENIAGVPSELQWKRIKEQVSKIDGAVTTYPVFINNYPTWPYWSIYPQPWRYVTCNDSSGLLSTTNTDDPTGITWATCKTELSQQFEPIAAYHALGAAEWQATAGELGSGVYF